MIGLDIAKSVFQVHGEDAAGNITLRKKLSRLQLEGFFTKLPACLVGIEACGTSHHWGRTLTALGHEVRLIPAMYVKPFVKRNKNDARDAAAICVALGRPDMRAVAIKSVDQQAMRVLERARELLVKQQVQLTHCCRAMMAEMGIVAAQGRRGFDELRALISAGDARVPGMLMGALQALVRQIDTSGAEIKGLGDKIMASAKAHADMRRLATIPGIGGLTAHAIVAAIGDGKRFGCARDFAAWLGLTPRGHSSGGKERQRGISRAGDTRLRSLLTLGASTLIRFARSHEDRATAWQSGILARRPVKVAVLAQAAKTARIARAVLTSGAVYRRPGGEAAPIVPVAPGLAACGVA